MSQYIPFVPHIVFVESLKDSVVEEALPKGEKQKGLKGVLHALRAEWEVRRGRGD
jgi:hypothetical protein